MHTVRMKGKGALSEKQVQEITESLHNFVEHSVEKYVAGQAEHGGSIQDRDLDLEIDHELIDLFFYHEARKRNP